MIYQEFWPTPALRPYVLKYGILEAHLSEKKKTTQLLPPFLSKAFIIRYLGEDEILCKLGPYEGPLSNGYFLAHAESSGFWTYENSFGFFAIIFQPGKFRDVFDFPMIDYLNWGVNIEDVKDAHTLDLFYAIRAAQSSQARIKAADKHLVKILSKRRLRTGRDLIDESIRQLFTHTDLNIRAIGKDLPVSERHLRRLFVEQVGISPKNYQKQIRFIKALNILQSGRFRNLSSVAQMCGYYDQSQFIGQFRFFMGVTPKQFLQQQFQIAESVYWRKELQEKIMKMRDV